MKLGVWKMRKLLVVLLVLPAMAPVIRAQQEAAKPPNGEAAASCTASCRGLGVEKVKAGDEHCGLVARERKDKALDLACSLAEEHQDELEERAEERASSRCSEALDRDGCTCRTVRRPWQNVYTNQLSQRCWAECGWVALVECETG